jgi:putative zinc finger/helix-turn-helix YgiT family protein
MKCLECKNEKFKTEKARFHPTVKDEQIDVLVDATVCAKCGKAVMDDTQMDGLRRAAADGYRKKHELLTSGQIAEYRSKLGMSQREFAEHLGVGEASIKRWETYYVQDRSQDNLIRLKCDESSAEDSALVIHRRIYRDSAHTGGVQFNFDRIRDLIIRLVDVAKSRLFLNKALFYVDFLHFKRHGRGITGLTYFAIDYGPCPYRYDTLYEPLLRNGDLSKGNGHNLRAEQDPNDALFDAKEMETIQFVHDYIKRHGQQKLLDMSHEEAAYTETEDGGFISYELAKKLSVK